MIETGCEPAWSASQLRRSPRLWSHPLTDGDRDLLWEDALRGRWGAADSVRVAVRDGVRGGLESVGFAHVPNLVDTSAGEEDVTAALTFLLTELGQIVPQNGTGDLTTVLRDRDGDGYTELGFHCDTCDLLVLLCLRPAVNGGGETKLASARRVRDILAAERPDVLALLQQDWRFDRTGRAGPQSITSPILTTRSDGTVACYYQTRTARDTAEMDGGLTPQRREALDVLDEVLYRPEIAFRLLLDAGDLLVINNHRVLHGRSPYVDAPGPLSRRVLRVWMNVG